MKVKVSIINTWQRYVRAETKHKYRTLDKGIVIIIMIIIIII